MKNRKSKFSKYFKEYEWSNVATMIRNNRLAPKPCSESSAGKLVLITGATSGIGKLTAEKYAANGANLLCINRNKPKSETLAANINKSYNVKCDYLLADLSKLDDIHRVCQHLMSLDKPIDVIIHNAGVHRTKKEYTDDGLEKVFVVNYLSSFIINYRLKEKLKAQDCARIILVNSEGYRFAAWGLNLEDLNWHKRRYSGLKSYGSAKLAQLLSMLIFDQYFENSGVTINAMHPGAVKSETGKENGALYKFYKRNFLDKILKPTEISAEALYYLGASKEIDSVSGKFFNLTTIEEPAPPALDIEEAEKLWKITLKLINNA